MPLISFQGRHDERLCRDENGAEDFFLYVFFYCWVGRAKKSFLIASGRMASPSGP